MALLAIAGMTAAAGAVMVLAANGATATPAPKPSGSGGGNANNVTFCHRTNSNTNPYVEITTDPNSIIKEGHGHHTGPIWNPTLKSQHIKWGDIIPPFVFTDKKGTHSFPGLNWNSEGMAILDNGCKIPASGSSGSSGSTGSTGSSGASGASSSANSGSSTANSNSPGGASSATGSPAPIPGGVSAGLHTPLSNAGLEAWGIVLLVLGGLGGLSVGMWPTRRRVH